MVGAGPRSRRREGDACRRQDGEPQLPNGRAEGGGPRGGAHKKYPPPHTTPLRPGTRGAATARGALGWYRPSVGVPRDVGCCAPVVFAAYIFSVQFRGELQLGPKNSERKTGVQFVFVPRWRCGAVGLIYNLLCFKSKAYSKAVHHTAAPRHGAGSMVCKCM